jgi:hypothetical protein
LQWAIIGSIDELQVVTRVVPCDGVFDDDVELVRYDLILRRVLEAREEGRDVDGREGRREEGDGLERVY